MKTINIIFDASVIIKSFNETSFNRAGIFWCAFNILKQFNNSELYKVTLLVSPEIIYKKKGGLKDFIFSFPVIIYFDKILFKKKLNFWINQLNRKNFLFFILANLFKYCIQLGLIFIPKTKNKLFNDFDIYFSPVHGIPDIIKENPKIKSFHILHDAIASLSGISTASPLKSNFRYINLIENLNKETFYFCVSECTKNDFLKLFQDRLDEKKMFVTPNAAAQSFYPNYDKHELQRVLKKYGITQKQGDCYIFSFCSVDPRKNIVFTCKCFINFLKKHSINNMYFYIGGAHFPEYSSIFEKEISEFTYLKNRIVRLGYVDDQDVNILYSNSLLFTYISQYEGFGMPPLEAMQAGAPVICSNNSSLPEVVGDAAITIDYNSEEQCVKAFEDLYFNDDLRKIYIKKGLERAKLFSWEKTFNIMSNIIQEKIK